MQAYMVGPSGVLRKALFSRGVAARLVAVRGLLYMIIQQLRAMDEGEAEEAVEADLELSCSQASAILLANDTPHSALHERNDCGKNCCTAMFALGAISHALLTPLLAKVKLQVPYSVDAIPKAPHSQHSMAV